jgi:hypothetical protein
VATFGSVPPRSGHTQVSIDTGGDLGFQGREYCVTGNHGAIRTVLCGPQWIS